MTCVVNTGWDTSQRRLTVELRRWSGARPWDKARALYEEAAAGGIVGAHSGAGYLALMRGRLREAMSSFQEGAAHGSADAAEGLRILSSRQRGSGHGGGGGGVGGSASGDTGAGGSAVGVGSGIGGMGSLGTPLGKAASVRFGRIMSLGDGDDNDRVGGRGAEPTYSLASHPSARNPLYQSSTFSNQHEHLEHLRRGRITRVVTGTQRLNLNTSEEG